MWEKVEKKFAGYPSQMKVVRKFLEYGIRVEKGRMWCGNIEMSLSKVARAVGVDRKVVINAINIISKDKLLADVFLRLKPVCHVGEAAKVFGYGVIEVHADPMATGVVSVVSSIISKAGIVIRYIIGDDPDISVDPKITIVTNTKLPGKVIEKLSKFKIVKKVIIS